MARCGCAAGCACMVVGSGPVTVTGNGTPGAPFTVALSYGGGSGCAAIAACMAEHVGAGLIYDQATGDFQARISRDPGNALIFGTDNGLFTTGGGGGGGAVCQKSVAALPATGLVGAYALAGLMGPFNSPYQADYCISNDVDLVQFFCTACSDGVGWVGEYNTGQVSTARSSIYETDLAPSVDSATMQSVTNLAGDRNNPYAGETIVNRTPTCGWYGWLAPTYQQPLVPQMLRRIGGKAVALLDCRYNNASDVEARNVQAALRAIRDECAQQWTMIGVDSPANGTTAINAGVAAMVMAVATPSTYGSTTLPVTLAALNSAGITWLALNYFYADSVFQTYVQGGINVLMYGATRHVHRTRAATLGCRGFLGHDPVYTRGPDVFDYRATRDPWTQRRMGNGQLSPYTDQMSVTGPTVRGYHRAPTSGNVSPEGLMLPARWGNGGTSPQLLCGFKCPLPDPNNYTLRADVMFQTLPIGAVGKLGFAFGMVSDANQFQWNGSDGNPAAMPVTSGTARRFYFGYLRSDGHIGIGLQDGATYTDLSNVASPAVTVNQWDTLTIAVTPTTITLKRFVNGGSVANTTVATNSLIRGPYFAVSKEELHPENSQYGFIGGFTNLSLT